MKKIFFLLIIALLSNCDFSVPLTINEDVIYPLNSSCGKIEFRASFFGNWITIYQDINEGEHLLRFDSLNISFDPPGILEIDKLKFYENGIPLENISQMEVKKGDIIKAYIIFKNLNNTYNGNMLILPCSYLTCAGQPLINDTIRIQFKGKKLAK